MIINETQFHFRPGKGTINGVLIIERLKEEYHAKGKSCMHFVDLFLTKKLELIRSEKIPDISDRSVINLL